MATALLLALLPLSGPALASPRPHQPRPEALQAAVEDFLASLARAYESEDREALRAHFEHGDLLPDDHRALRMLGRLAPWEKPVESVEDEGGAIAVTLILDPESPSPAQRATLHLVPSDDGRLLLRSEATAEELAELRSAKAARDAGERELDALEEELASRPTRELELWTELWEAVERAAQEMGEQQVARMREFRAVVRPLGQACTETRCAMWMVLPGGDGLQVNMLPLERLGERWEMPDVTPESMAAFEALATEATATRVRPAGVAIERVPALVRFLLGLRERTRAAARAGREDEAQRLLELALLGIRLDPKWTREALDSLRRWGREPVTGLRVGSQTTEGERGTISLIAEHDEGSTLYSFDLRRAESGWVLAGRHESLDIRAAIETQARVEAIADALRTATSENAKCPAADSVPALLDELTSRALLGESVTAEDAWGTPLRYVASEETGGAWCRVISAGADREFEPESVWRDYGTFAQLERDLVLSNRGPVRAWSIDR